MLFGKSSEFSTMVYINYYYPLIFHRFTPDFPRVFLLLAIYSLISHNIPLIHMISSYPLVNVHITMENHHV